jgi:Alpha-kinase family
VDSLGGFHLFGLFNVSPHKNVRKSEYISMEPYLQGEWEKFNSNGGWSNDDYKLLQAFSHWTACKSGFRFLLCDLQGVCTSTEYRITDPAIHSLEQIHGPSDLGIAGMEKFLEGHECNFICQELQLERNPVVNNFSHRRIGTTYSFELSREEQERNRLKRGKYINPMACVPELDF